jgi:hypothetical protein
LALNDALKNEKAATCAALFRPVIKNYLVSAAGAASAGAAASVAGAGAAVVSAAGAISSTGAASSAGATVSSVVSSVLVSLQETKDTLIAATKARLRNTFFILLNYKRLIINSRQRYKFFNMENYFDFFFWKNSK